MLYRLFLVLSLLVVAQASHANPVPTRHVVGMGAGDQYGGLFGLQYRLRLGIPVEPAVHLGLGWSVGGLPIGAGTSLRWYPFVTGDPMATPKRKFYLAAQYGHLVHNIATDYPFPLFMPGLGWSGYWDFSVGLSPQDGGFFGVSLGKLWNLGETAPPTLRAIARRRLYASCLESKNTSACQRRGSFRAYAEAVSRDPAASPAEQLHACQHLVRTKGSSVSCGPQGAKQLRAAAALGSEVDALEASMASLAARPRLNGGGWQSRLDGLPCRDVGRNATYAKNQRCAPALRQLRNAWDPVATQEEVTERLIRRVDGDLEALVMLAGSGPPGLRDRLVADLEAQDCSGLDELTDLPSEAARCTAVHDALAPAVREEVAIVQQAAKERAEAQAALLAEEAAFQAYVEEGKCDLVADALRSLERIREACAQDALRRCKQLGQTDKQTCLWKSECGLSPQAYRAPAGLCALYSWVELSARYSRCKDACKPGGLEMLGGGDCDWRAAAGNPEAIRRTEQCAVPTE